MKTHRRRRGEAPRMELAVLRKKLTAVKKQHKAMLQEFITKLGKAPDLRP